jgi:hypothetical protein
MTGEYTLPSTKQRSDPNKMSGSSSACIIDFFEARWRLRLESHNFGEGTQTDWHLSEPPIYRQRTGSFSRVLKVVLRTPAHCVRLAKLTRVYLALRLPFRHALRGAAADL